MVGNPRSALALVQRLGFFWEYPRSKGIDEFLAQFDPEEIRKAAYHQVRVITSLLDRNYSAYGMRMIDVLGLDSLEKIWEYRLYLMRAFGIKLPQNRSQQVWLQNEAPEEYELARLVKEFAAVLPKGYKVQGVVIGDFAPDYSLIGKSRGS